MNEVASTDYADSTDKKTIRGAKYDLSQSFLVVFLVICLICGYFQRNAEVAYHFLRHFPG
jgi:hypothetical protein